MMKDSKNRAMKPEGVSTKKFLVLRGCEMPHVGAWKTGDVIEDPEIIEKVKDNPNFKPIKEGKSK